ncbi:hypothetical protein D910_08635 [Dendroctonus ponderosae]
MCSSVDIEIVLKSHSTEEDSFTSLIHSIVIGDVSPIPVNKGKLLDLNAHKINWYVYTLDTDGPTTQVQADEDGEITLATHLTLPSKELFTLWENLYYEDNIKENILQYGKTMMEFSKKGINANIISCNRVILLHGPPGTGKTSLCKALAQKLCVQMRDVYSSGVLIEINSHSLFSKWFSESGKLVTNMFSQIKEICENSNLLVCVLMDEVESLAHARDQSISGNEPSDAVRVVNAMLTQIDQIKKCPNVLILATSNMTEAIDLAFVDRADIKQYLGLPSVPAIYKIYHSCLVELLKEHSKQLIKICEASVQLSGRTLRKIPFLAYALFINGTKNPDLRIFLDAMDKAVEKEHQQRKDFKTRK